MSTLELRQAIIEYLTQIEDVSLLNAIKTMIETKASEEIYQLTDDQVKRVEEGRAQLTQGKTISNESLKLEIDQWLSTK
jgi:hypothetical protein